MHIDTSLIIRFLVLVANGKILLFAVRQNRPGGLTAAIKRYGGQVFFLI